MNWSQGHPLVLAPFLSVQQEPGKPGRFRFWDRREPCRSQLECDQHSAMQRKVSSRMRFNNNTHEGEEANKIDNVNKSIAKHGKKSKINK